MSFSSLGLSEPIVRAVSERGYTEPTPVQKQAIPAVLSGGDIMAGAQTGTGKTAGFTLPILQRLSQTPPSNASGRTPIRALVLTPTRELAAQVEESVREYGKHLDVKSMVMFGGVGINPQIAQLRKRVDILVATPGRLLDHVQQKTLDLSRVEILVLDEADRMLDMGFIRDIRKILALLPAQRQNLLFSATFSDEIKQLADGLLRNPSMIEVARRNAPAELVQQKVMLAAQPAKAPLLAHLIKEHAWYQVLVFTRTKHRANWLAEKLTKSGVPALAIHGNKSQNARTRALSQFKDGSLQVLVATDIAARGLDIVDLPHVVNFELPNVPEDYVHRIGRTGRAGAAGEALSLVAQDELPLLADIEKLIKRRLPREAAAGFELPPEPAPAEKQARQESKRPSPRQKSVRNGADGPDAPKERKQQQRSAGQKPAPMGEKRGPSAERRRRPDQARGPAALLASSGLAGGAGSNNARFNADDEEGGPNGNVLPPGWERDAYGILIPPPPPPDVDGNVRSMPSKPTQGGQRQSTGSSMSADKRGRQQPGSTSRGRGGRGGNKPRNVEPTRRSEK